jgi:hypothetical protein
MNLQEVALTIRQFAFIKRAAGDLAYSKLSRGERQAWGRHPCYVNLNDDGDGLEVSFNGSSEAREYEVHTIQLSQAEVEALV